MTFHCGQPIAHPAFPPRAPSLCGPHGARSATPKEPRPPGIRTPLRLRASAAHHPPCLRGEPSPVPCTVVRCSSGTWVRNARVRRASGTSPSVFIRVHLWFVFRREHSSIYVHRAFAKPLRAPAPKRSGVGARSKVRVHLWFVFRRERAFTMQGQRCTMHGAVVRCSLFVGNVGAQCTGPLLVGNLSICVHPCPSVVLIRGPRRKDRRARCNQLAVGNGRAFFRCFGAWRTTSTPWSAMPRSTVAWRGTASRARS